MSSPLALEMPSDAINASNQIKNWAKKITKINQLKENMLVNLPITAVETLLDAIDATSSSEISFEGVQKIITSVSFTEALTQFLKVLPKDKWLLALPLSTRLVSSCVVISLFPDAVLVPSSPTGGADTESFEARQTYLSARFLVKALHRFLKYIKILLRGGKNENSSNANISTLATFKQVLLCYRFVSRTFFASLDSWKKTDNLRFISSLEVSYCQCYAVILQCKCAPVDERAKIEEMEAEAQQQITKITALLRQLLKESAASRLEELQAQVHVHFADHSRGRAVSDLLPISVPADTTARIAADVTAGGLDQQADSAQAEVALNRLSDMIGVENEKIAYEIMYDPKFRLADAPAPETVMLPVAIDARAFRSSCPANATVAARMKWNMLFVLRDRLVWSLQSSPATTVADLCSGLVVPVRIGSGSFLSCEVVSVARTDDNTGGVASVDIVYLVDGTAETVSDITRIRLSPDDVDPLPLMLAIEDLRSRLLSLAPKGITGAERLHIDMALLRELLLLRSTGSLREAARLIVDSFGGLFGYLVDLQSPARAEEMLAWWEAYHDLLQSSAAEITNTNGSLDFAALAPSFFEYMTASIDQLKRDLANYYVSSVAPVLSKHGPAFMLGRFVSRLRDVPPANVVNMLNHLLQSPGDKFAAFKLEVNEAYGYSLLGEPDASFRVALAGIAAAPSRSALLLRAAVARMMVNILQKPFRLNTADNHALLPETLHVFETGKLAAMRDDVDIISLELAIVIATKQILATPCLAVGYHGGILLSEEEELTLCRRLDVLLRESDIEVEMLATEVAATVSRCASAHTASVSSAFADEILKTLQGVVSAKNPVLAIFSKRLYKVIFRAMLDLPYAGCLGTYSLHSSAQAAGIKDVASLAQKVFSVHFSVYRPLYADLLSSEPFLESLEEKQ